ncbi:MAG: CHASE domain-containing protein, partial [Gammaproteobacteria bacterium]|nr:CHASE domain-containing protein [Gammaproteobacteria bacterium]
MGGDPRVRRVLARSTIYAVAVCSYVGGLFQTAAHKAMRLAGVLGALGRTVTGPARWRVSVPSLDALRAGMPSFLRERAPEAIVLVVGIVIAVAGFLTVRYYDEAADRHEFDRKAAHHLLVSRKAVDRYVEAVSEVGAWVSEFGGQVNRWEFFKFTEDRLPDYPGIKALAWAPRVAESDRTALEKAANDDGLFNFRVTERATEGMVIEAGFRPEYSPIYYVEPFEGNEDFLGFDLAFRPTYRSALERARDSGTMSTAFAAPADAANNAKATLLVISPV